MADNNHNRSNQYNDEWNQQRNRLHEGEEGRNRNEGQYGSANYGNEFGQGNRRSQYGNSGSGQQGFESGRPYGGAYSSDYGNPYGSGYEQSNYDSRRTDSQQGNSGWGRYEGESQWNQNAGYGQQRGQYNQQRGEWNSGYNPDVQRRNAGYGNDQGYSSQHHERSGSSFRNENYGEGRYGNAGYGSNANYGSGYAGNRGWENRHEGGGSNRDRSWWDRTKDEVSSWFGGEDSNERRAERQYGPYRGKGPKDYRRSEDRIREDVCDRLSDDDYLDATNIQVQIQNNEVILSGTVENREQKRRAEDLVESISGVRNVENRLRVGSSREDFSARDYTGNTDRTGGIGTESGTTNEIIRNERKK